MKLLWRAKLAIITLVGLTAHSAEHPGAGLDGEVLRAAAGEVRAPALPRMRLAQTDTAARSAATPAQPERRAHAGAPAARAMNGARPIGAVRPASVTAATTRAASTPRPLLLAAAPRSAATRTSSMPALDDAPLLRKQDRFLARPLTTTARLTLSSDVPEGFEEFHTPQKTLVDVYYAGILLGTTSATYTTDGIEFLQPEEVVDRIPNVISRTALIHHLTGSIPRNSDLACQPGQVAGCGKLEPEFIGVIFDDARFRADIFVHPDMLYVQQRDVSRYLPMPADPDQLTLVQNLGAVASEDSIADSAHTVSGNTWIARGNDHLHALWYNTDTQSLAVDELALQRDRPDHSYTGGIFQGRGDGLSFAQSGLLAGVGVGRSLKLRTDIENEGATRLLLFLDSRSMVEIYKDGRLASSSFYDAGNQLVDTSRLPTGAYDIEIRVTDAAGTTRTVNRFFVKTSQLAPKGEPQWYVEGGQAMRRDLDRILPEDAGSAQVRGGYQRRVTEDFGFAVAGAAVETHAMAEGGATWMQPLYNLTGSLMLSTQGDAGWSTTVNGRWHALSGTASLRQAWAENEPGDTADYQLVPGSSTSRNLVLNYPALGGQVSGSAYYTRSAASESEIYSLRFSRGFTTETLPLFVFSAQLSNADGDLVAQLGVDFTGIDRHWYWRMNPGVKHSSPNSGSDSTEGNFSAVGGWRDAERWSEDVEASLRATVEDGVTTVGADGLYASDLGRLQAGYDDIQGNDVDIRRMAARYDASFVATSSQVAYGGRQAAAGSVIIDLRSAPDDAEFDVLVDGRKQLAVRGGKRVPMMLQPYRTYDIRLVDRGLNFLHYDNMPHQVTLYPGSVVPLAYKVERVVIAFGRVLHKQNICSIIDETCYDVIVPLRNARLSGIAGFSMTDSDGTFQAEVITGTKRLHATKGDIECDLELPEPRWVNGMMLFGDLTCITEFVAEKLPTTAISVSPSDGHLTEGTQPPDAPTPATPLLPLIPPAAASTPAAGAGTTIVIAGRLLLQQRVCSISDETCHDITLPMRNATVRSGIGETVSARDGTFRVEASADTATLSVTRGESACVVTFAPPPITDGVRSLGDVRCRLNDEGAAPTSPPAPTPPDAGGTGAGPGAATDTGTVASPATAKKATAVGPAKKPRSKGSALRAVREKSSALSPAATPKKGAPAATEPRAPAPAATKPESAQPAAKGERRKTSEERRRERERRRQTAGNAKDVKKEAAATATAAPPSR